MEKVNFNKIYNKRNYILIKCDHNYNYKNKEKKLKNNELNDL